MNIKKFLDDYSNVLLEEHKDTVEKRYKFLQQYENVDKVNSKYGEHYVNCPWSSNSATEGPDTCACHTVEWYNQEIQRLINFYMRITRNNCAECRKGFDLY